jgi:hypothetical protein
MNQDLPEQMFDQEEQRVVSTSSTTEARLDHRIGDTPVRTGV